MYLVVVQVHNVEKDVEGHSQHEEQGDPQVQTVQDHDEAPRPALLKQPNLVEEELDVDILLQASHVRPQVVGGKAANLAVELLVDGRLFLDRELHLWMHTGRCVVTVTRCVMSACVCIRSADPSYMLRHGSQQPFVLDGHVLPSRQTCLGCFPRLDPRW